MWSLDEFENQRVRAGRFFEPIDGADVWVIQGGENLRFASKTREPLGVRGKGFWKNLESDVALQRAVPRAIHLAHPAGAD